MDDSASAARPLVGRTEQRAVLGGLVDALASGTPFLASLRGEAGAGKTTLLGEAVSTARAHGVSVVVGSGTPMTTERPLSAALDLLAFGDPVDAVDRRDISAATDESGRADAADAIADCLLDAGQARPLLVVLDDAQWLDGWSWHVIDLLAQRSSTSSVGVIVAHRPHPSPTGLARLSGRHAELVSLELGPLTADEVDELVARWEGSPPGAALRETVASAQGNPFLVEEILASLRARDALVAGDGGVDVVGPARPSVDVSRWFVDGDDQIESVLAIASLLGQRFTISELAAASGRTTVALVEPITGALQSGLLRESDVDLAFRHDLIRDRLYDSIPASVRHALHREIASRQEERGGDAVRIAEQLVLAGVPDDRAGVDLLVRTADRLPRTQAPLAIHCRRLAVQGPADAEDAVRLRTELAVALLDDGRADECRALLEGELDRAVDPATASTYRQLLGSALFALGRYAEVASVLEQVPDDQPHRLRAFAAAAVPVMRGDLEGAAELAASLRTQPDVPEPTKILLIGVESQSRALQGWLPDAVRLAAEGVERFEQAGRPVDVARFSPYTLLVSVLSQSDAPADVIAEKFADGDRQARSEGLRALTPLLSANYAEELFRQGRWDDAQTLAETATALIDQGASNLALRLLLTIRTQIVLRRGDAESAAPLVERAAAEPLGATAFGLDWQLWTQAVLAHRRSGPDAARQPLQLLADIVEQFGALVRQQFLAPFAVGVALDAGDHDLAARYVELARALADRSEAPTSVAAAMLTSAMLDGDVELARSAVERYATTNRPLEHAGALGRLAVLLAAGRRLGEARSAGADAIARLGRLGASGDAAQLASELAPHGLIMKVARPQRPVAGWASLTDSERRVAVLVGEGLANGEIADRLGIGRRTVETHLYRVFPKLGVANRTELAMEVVRQAALR